MLSLKGEQLYLRALEPEDLQFLFEIENNPEIWEISGTLRPYSRQLLKSYLDNAHKDIFEVKQLRLCISNYEHQCIGLIDLFDFNPNHRRAGVGIIISDKKERQKGSGTEALNLLVNYAFTVLGLKQIYANVGEDNEESLKFFNKLGFDRVGVKKDWIRSGNSFKNEIMFQKINN